MCFCEGVKFLTAAPVSAQLKDEEGSVQTCFLVMFYTRLTRYLPLRAAVSGLPNKHGF